MKAYEDALAELNQFGVIAQKTARKLVEECQRLEQENQSLTKERDKLKSDNSWLSVPEHQRR